MIEGSIQLWYILDAVALIMVLAFLVFVIRSLYAKIDGISNEFRSRLNGTERALFKLGNELRNTSFAYWWMRQNRQYNPDLAQEMWNHLKERRKDGDGGKEA